MEGNARKTYPFRVTHKVRAMESELDPSQRAPVEVALAELLAAERPPPPDPWWAEGLREMLDS